MTAYILLLLHRAATMMYDAAFPQREHCDVKGVLGVNGIALCYDRAPGAVSSWRVSMGPSDKRSTVWIAEEGAMV